MGSGKGSGERLGGEGGPLGEEEGACVRHIPEGLRSKGPG